MNLEEAINSDDVEIAELAANLLLKKVTIKKIKSFLKKGNKYRCEYEKNYIFLYPLLGYQWTKYKKMVNAPLLKMTEVKNNIVYVNGDADTITFNLPYKIDEE